MHKFATIFKWQRMFISFIQLIILYARNFVGLQRNSNPCLPATYSPSGEERKTLNKYPENKTASVTRTKKKYTELYENLGTKCVRKGFPEEIRSKGQVG